MDPILILIGLAGLAIFFKKTKVTVDFTQIVSPDRYQLVFTDSKLITTIFDSANGAVQTKSLASGQYSIAFVNTNGNYSNCPAYVEVAAGVILGDLNLKNSSATLKPLYTFKVQCR